MFRVRWFPATKLDGRLKRPQSTHGQTGLFQSNRMAARRIPWGGESVPHQCDSFTAPQACITL